MVSYSRYVTRGWLWLVNVAKQHYFSNNNIHTQNLTTPSAQITPPIIKKKCIFETCLTTSYYSYFIGFIKNTQHAFKL